MAQSLREVAVRLGDFKDRVSDPELVSAIEDVIAEAVAEILARDTVAQDLGVRISARQVQELVALYGPTSFSRAHLAPELIAQEIMQSGLL